jgi:hypothetical protein
MLNSSPCFRLSLATRLRLGIPTPSHANGIFTARDRRLGVALGEDERFAWSDWLTPEIEEYLRRRRAEMGEGYDVDLRRRILVGHWPLITIEQLDIQLASLGE